jgi:hypothetical protein
LPPTIHRASNPEQRQGRLKTSKASRHLEAEVIEADEDEAVRAKAGPQAGPQAGLKPARKPERKSVRFNAKTSTVFFRSSYAPTMCCTR